MKPEEHEMAIAVDWLDNAGFSGCYFHVPNENNGNAHWRKKLKRLGVRSGVPDLHIIRMTPGGAPGVVWEMKSPGNGPTPEQRRWLALYQREGWHVGCGPAWKFIDMMKDSYEL